MTRRRHRSDWDQHVSGVRATFDADCAKCGDNINVGDRVAKTNKGWAHIACVSGWSE